MSRTVIRANYIAKGSPGARARLRVSVAYYAKEKDISGEPVGEVKPFNTYNDELHEEELKSWMNDYDSTREHAYRAVLSPGLDMTEEDLREHVRNQMGELETLRGHEINYVAFSHMDHEHPHAHIVFREETTLTKTQLEEWRSRGDEHATQYETRRAELEHEHELPEVERDWRF